MTHEASRILLRPWLESDAADLFLYAQDLRVGPVAGWPPHTSVEDSLNIIRTIFAKPEIYAICLKKDQKPIGCVGLMFGKDSSLFELDEKEAEVGYWIGVPFWGKGLVSEAVQCLMQYAFDTLELEKLWGGYYYGNDQSKRVLEKCGFKYKYSTKPTLCPQMNDMRIEHINCITREEYDKTIIP